MHKAIFKNCSEAVIDFIEKTQHSLQIGMCWFTHPGIFEVLFNAGLRGVQVSIVKSGLKVYTGSALELMVLITSLLGNGENNK